MTIFLARDFFLGFSACPSGNAAASLSLVAILSPDMFKKRNAPRGAKRHN
jgi:hypothetical protein